MADTRGNRITRNRYFHARLLTARDLADEQDYFLERLKLSARRAGFGVVKGFEVTKYDDHCLRISKGLAVDRHGRDVLLLEERLIDVRHWCWESENGDGNGSAVSRCLGVRSMDQPVDPLPLLDEELSSEAGASRGEDGVVRAEVRFEERVEPCFIDPAKLDPDIDTDPAELNADIDEKDTYVAHWLETDGEPEPKRAEFRRECFVPLALVTVKKLEAEPRDWCIASGVDQGARSRRRVYPGLARIQSLTWDDDRSWQHDGDIPQLPRLIKIEFDAPLEVSEKAAGGLRDDDAEAGKLSRMLVVTLERPDGSSCRLLPDPARPPYIDEEQRDALVTSITAPPSAAPGDQDLLRVRLNCDFLMDDTGQAVDGSFLGGRLPTGNGCPGGIFESWVTIRINAPSKGDGA